VFREEFRKELGANGWTTSFSRTPYDVEGESVASIEPCTNERGLSTGEGFQNWREPGGSKHLQSSTCFSFPETDVFVRTRISRTSALHLGDHLTVHYCFIPSIEGFHFRSFSVHFSDPDRPLAIWPKGRTESAIKSSSLFTRALGARLSFTFCTIFQLSCFSHIGRLFMFTL
jgi:hypothetical protein